MIAVKHFLKSVHFAGRGLVRAWHNEPNFRSETIAALLVILLALWLEIGAGGLAIIIMTSFTVLAMELINTMVESISDMLKPRLDAYVKQIKDLTAAAVAITALGSIGVAICLLLPPIINLFW